MTLREMFILLLLWAAVAIVGISIVDARLPGRVAEYEAIHGR
mgnify:CR=1 FL=1